MPPSLLVNERGELVHAFGGASRFLQLARRPAGPRRARAGRPRAEDGARRRLEARAARAGARSSTRACASESDGERRLQGHDPAGRQPQRRRAPRARLVRAVEAAPRQQRARRREIEMRPGLARAARHARGRAQPTPRRTCRRRSRSSRPATRSCRRRTRSCRRRTKSCRARTRSCRASTRSSTRSTPSTSARSPSSPSSTNDMDNLLSSTDVGTIFLDGQLRIRKFTPQIAETFNLLPHDVGRLDRDLREQDGPPRADRRPEARARDGRAGRARAARRRGQARSSCASCPTAPRARSTASCSRSSTSAASRRPRTRCSTSATCSTACSRPCPTRSTSRTRAAGSSAPTTRWPTRLGLGSPAEAVGKTGFELPEQSAAMALHRAGRGGAARRGEAQHYKLEKRRTAGRSDGVGPGDAAPAARRRGRHRRRHRDLPRRDRAEARRGEDPGGGAPARPVPRHALARAAQSARRDRHRDGAAQGEPGVTARRTAALSADPRAAVASRWRACSTTCSRRAASRRTRSS